MDTVAAIITALHTKLTGDGPGVGTLVTLMGGAVSLHPVWAPQDTPFPYLVHTLRPAEGWTWGMQDSGYELNIWDEARNAGRALEVRGRIITLLDQKSLAVAEASAVRLFKQFDQAIPDDTPDIWRWQLTFALRYFRKAEVAAITA
jgi:hypothetical protein